MENYLAIERDEFMIHAATHMNLKITILSERSQRPPPHQKNGAHALSFHLCKHLENENQPIVTESISVVVWECRCGWGGPGGQDDR